MRPSCVLALLTAASLLVPPQAWAAPEGDATALAAFEAGFTEGQAMFDRGEFLAAAKKWVEAASKLRETNANRDNRVAVFEYVADAYSRGLAQETELAPLREAVAALDGYCDGFTRAYGTETPISPKIVAARDDFKARLAATGSKDPEPVASDPIEAPRRDEPKPTGKPWKGLTIGGSVALGLGVVGLALGVAGGVRGRSKNDEFEANACSLNMPSVTCSDLLSEGKAANTQAIVGAIVGGVLLGTGAALLVVGLKRKKAAQHAWAPMLGPGMIGLGLRGSF